MISGYLGKSDTFDKAIGEFTLAYADKNEKDHAALVAAVKAGRIRALSEEDQSPTIAAMGGLVLETAAAFNETRSGRPNRRPPHRAF